MKNIITVLVLFCMTNIQSQRLTKAQVESLPPTIKNQFIKVFRGSGNYQEYKVIKRTKFLNLQKNVLDSITIIKKEFTIKEKQILQYNVTIDSLKQKTIELNNNLKLALNNKDSISLFGIPLQKSNYNIIMWLIILTLLFGMSFFVYKFKNGDLLTKEAKKNLTEIELEFEQHRKKALEKEQKLRRELQDEINKQRGV